MLPTPRGLRPPRRDEAEKPFWISFSDLMSALMVLFLVSMSVALLAITHEISASAEAKNDREADIAQLLQHLAERVAAFPGVTLRGQTLDFGERARFDSDSHRLSHDTAQLLRRFTPELLALAHDPLGERWLKRVVVEGYADPRGGYLHNLHLSLMRSERVLCLLLTPVASGDGLSASERQQVRELFRVGGASYNRQQASLEASRRIEMRLEFRDPDEERSLVAAPQLDADTRCPLDG